MKYILMIALVIGGLFMFMQNGNANQTMKYEELQNKLNAQENFVLLDVRTQEEFDAGHIASAILLPYDEINLKAATVLPDKEKEIERVRKLTLSPNAALNKKLEELGTTPLSTGIKMAELIKRPEVSYFDLTDFDKERPSLPYETAMKVETEIKYEGYIARQKSQVEEMLKLENRKLPTDVDYTEVEGLRLEAREKLNKVKPENIGQASRISGVSPSDISVLSIWAQKRRMEKNS